MLELLRICTRVSGLPCWLILDLPALMRHAGDDPACWNGMVEVLNTTTRNWIVWAGSLAVPVNTVSDQKVGKLGEWIRAGVSANDHVREVVPSAEPLGAALHATGLASRYQIAVVTAGVGVDGRYHELWPLSYGVHAILDAGTGELWTRHSASNRVCQELGCDQDPQGPPGLDVALLPELAAVVGDRRMTGRPPLGTQYAAGRVSEVIRWLVARRPTEGFFEDHPSLHRTLLKAGPQVQANGDRLRGLGRADPTAREELASAFALGQRVDTVSQDATAYVAAAVDRVDDQYTIRSAAVCINGVLRSAKGDQARQLLAETVSRHEHRWFAPRALDLLAAMVDCTLPLPLAVVDPGLSAFILDPDHPPALADLTETAELFAPGQVSWMADVKRINPPSSQPEAIVEWLSMIDHEMGAVLERENLRAVVEDDIAKTLPVLARLEREGFWPRVPEGYADWTTVMSALEKKSNELTKAYEEVLGAVDLDTTPWPDVVEALKRRHGGISGEYWVPRMPPKYQVERYVANETAAAVALDEAKQIHSRAMDKWSDVLAGTPARVRGSQRPHTTGRWGFSDLPMQAVPKRGEVFSLIRRALGPPPGFILVGVDYNAFEVRLLAALSGDEELRRLCAEPDAHEAVAAMLTQRCGHEVSRNTAKAATLAVLYGSGLRSFMLERADVQSALSKQIYHLVHQAFPRVAAFREEILADYRDNRAVVAPGGWRRMLVAKDGSTAARKKAERQVFNTVIQGAGAYILRAVLRQLDAALPKLGAKLVHQVHDEVQAIAPDQHVDEVMKLIVEVMESTTGGIEGLRLVARAKKGESWAET